MRTLIAVLSLLACLAPHASLAVGRLADLSIQDRKTGERLPVYEHEGRYYVAGEPGHEYSLRLTNHGHGRVLAVTSVDGVNVISGETAAPDQTGYVLEAYAGTDITGWRKSMERVARFYFTRLKHSYAARTGRPHDVGVIGVALFRERQPEPPPRPCCWPFRSDQAESRQESQDAAAPAAEAQRESRSAEALSKSEKLGTGHGQSEHSVVSYTTFERASRSPDELIAIYYDSRKNLLAQGVIPQPRYASTARPSPFPGAFVPDP